MSTELGSAPSIKYKKRKRPSRTMSQQAPLATHDEFQLSDVSDNEDISAASRKRFEERRGDQKSPDSAPISKMKHYYSADDANSEDSSSRFCPTPENSPIVKCDPNNVSAAGGDDNNDYDNDNAFVEDAATIEPVVDKTITESAATGGNERNEDIQQQPVREEREDSEFEDEHIKNEIITDTIYEEKEVEEESEEEKDEEKESEQCEEVKNVTDNYNNNNEEDNFGDENVIVEEDETDIVDDVENQEEKQNEEDVEEKDVEEEDVKEEDVEEEDVEEKDVEEEDVEEEDVEEDDVEEDDVEEDDMEEDDAEENDVEEQEEDNDLPREEYYEDDEYESTVEAGDDPFSLEYYHSNKTKDSKQPKSSKIDPCSDPPTIVITEPSEHDLSIDGTKPVKPSRPRPPKAAKGPKRPPPPSGEKPKQKAPARPMKIPPPPPSAKRRAKQKNEEVLNQETKFPFKSHFEKKQLVPNPKKAILNVLKGESKKERKRKKDEEQFEKLLQYKEPEETPICESTDDWKAYKELQQRISASVSETKHKIQDIPTVEGDNNNNNNNNTEQNESDSKTWAQFEETVVEPKVEELDIFSEDFNTNNTADIITFEQKEQEITQNSEEQHMNKNDLAEFDIWGIDDLSKNEEKRESIGSAKKALYESSESAVKDSVFVETFNQQIDAEDVDNIREEEEEEDEIDDPFLAALAKNKKNMILDDDFDIEEEKKVVKKEYNDDLDMVFSNGIETDSKVKVEKETKEEIKPKQRQKPKRQETLSGNNPFRKGSDIEISDTEKNEELIPDRNVTVSKEEEDESPFMAVLKSVGITYLETESSTPSKTFDPLTTIYPDDDIEESAEEEKESDEEVEIDNKLIAMKHDQTSSSDSDSDEDRDKFGLFKIKTPVKIVEPSAELGSQPVVALPSPSMQTGQHSPNIGRGPRERKVQAEGKPYQRRNKDNLDELFDDLRSGEKVDDGVEKIDDEKVVVEEEEEEEEKIIKFESPLTGPFGAEEVEWEALPKVKSSAGTGENDVWGEEVHFDAEFEPLPDEIIEFEPFFPKLDNPEWKLLIRQPEKKSKAKQISRYTTNRWWREIYVRLGEDKDRPCLRLYENLEDDQPYRSIRLEPYMQLSRDKMQQYDKYGKLHIFKINHIVYKEMVGMRTEKFSLKSLQNLVSHKPKMNMVLDHMPMRTEIIKFGSLDQRPLRSLMNAIVDSMMTIKTHRDTSLEYTKEEVCCYVNDEYECKLSETGSILHQKARTRIHFAAFVTGQPYIVLGINDKWRYGNEVVSRKDIIPIMHDDWINIYEPEFHSCVDMDEYDKDHMIKFYPLDGCKFELIRFRVPLRSNKELPLIVSTEFKIDGVRVLIRVDLSVPGFFSASKRHGAVHCDDIEIRIPIPEEWAYHFRVEKHTRYGSVHSALRKPGKIKGLERITQLAQSLLPPSLLEASAGVAKYEHLYRSIVWRIPRLPDKHEGSYKPHMMTCRLVLAPQDSVPTAEEMQTNFSTEFTMSASTVSGATVRSISIQHTTTPERFVKYLATFKYNRQIDYYFGKEKPPPVKSILDEPEVPAVTDSNAIDCGPNHSSSDEEFNGADDDNNQASLSSRTPSVNKDLSMDLLDSGGGGGIMGRQSPQSQQTHSAIDDLMTLDFNSQPAVVDLTQSSKTGNIVSGNNLDDIAMVDD